MTGAALTARPVVQSISKAPAHLLVAGLAFVVLFWQPAATLVRDWWSDPEAGHGLLLFPVAAYFAWRRGWVRDARPQPTLGLWMLGGAVALRYLSGLAAELFTMRLSLFGAILAILVYSRGVRQLVYWWFPLTLLLLAIPLPAVVLSSLALPLQLRASRMGAWLLGLRHVPVRLDGNVIRLPGRSLFVTEACSGLRSLTALLSMGVLIGGIWLQSAVSRALVILAAIPVAMFVNGLRIFLTGFLVYWVDPALGDGFMHLSQGWALFVAALFVLAIITWLITLADGYWSKWRVARAVRGSVA